MWDEIAETYERALEFPPHERDAWLDAVCAGRAEVKREVAAMLRADQPLEIEHRLLGHLEGTRLGNYRIVKPLGQGGMGEVYLGAREDFDQLVAIKILRVHVPDAAARFRRERRILAHLTHPAVVPLLDSGVAPDGRPFLVLQYVDGLPITRYCDEKQLDVTARLRLFVDVCRAVQYAHGRLIIHRDLKPSNILVTPEGEARLLDFGIAKVIASDEETPTETPTELTRMDAPMTPERAAPEQLRGEMPSTATDVWALGVLLYELLTGRLPFDVAGRSRSEIERAVTASEPRRLRLGDIDTVVGVALRREPEQRYASAGQLADDVERVLGGQPILARPHSLGYRIRRFVGRNRAASIASSLAVLALIVFTAATFVQSREVARERDRAAAEEVKANAVVDLLVEILGGADPTSGGTPTIRVEDLLARGEQRARELDDQPAVQARLWHVLGKIQTERSNFTKAHELLTLAAAGPDQARVAEAVVDLADVEGRMGRRDEAKALLAKHIALLERDPAADKATYAALVSKLALVTGGAEGEKLAERALALRRALKPAKPVMVADSLNDLGTLAGNRGAYGEAAARYREALALLLPALGPDHSYVRTVKGNLALITTDHEEQIELFHDVIATQERRLGTWSEQVAIAYNNLGTALARRGDYDGSLRAFDEAMKRLRRVHGADHRQSLSTRGSIAAVLDLTGRTPEAIAELRRIRAAMAGAGADATWQQLMHVQYAVAMMRDGAAMYGTREERLGEAERWLRIALAELQRQGAADNLRGLRTRLGLALLLLARGDAVAAEQELRATIARCAPLAPPNDVRIAEAQVLLGRVLAAEGRKAEAHALLGEHLPPFAKSGVAHPEDVAAARRALQETRMSGTAP